MIHLLIIGHAPRSLAAAVLVGKVGGARQELTTRERIDVVSVTSHPSAAERRILPCCQAAGIMTR